MSAKIAICILVHNNIEIIEEVLSQRILNKYKENNIDVFAIDDSDDECIKNYVEKLNSEGIDNINYCDAHSVIGGDGKMFNIVNGRFVPKGYDYIWPIKGRVYFSDTIIEEVSKKCANKESDVILMANLAARYTNDWPNLMFEYNDPTLFFYHFGAYSTNWQNVIYKYDTMFGYEDWNEFEEKYKLTSVNPFNQTVFLFSRLKQLEECKISIVRYSNDDIEIKGSSGWKNSKGVFTTWIELWTKAIFSLPEEYNPYKAYVIKSQTNCPELFGTVDNLRQLVKYNALDLEYFNGIKDVWFMYSDVPADVVELILSGDEQLLAERIVHDYLVSLKNREYNQSYYIFMGNTWMEQLFGQENYNIIKKAYLIFRREYVNKGCCDLFDNVEKYEDIIENMKKYTKK